MKQYFVVSLTFSSSESMDEWARNQQIWSESKITSSCLSHLKTPYRYRRDFDRICRGTRHTNSVSLEFTWAKILKLSSIFHHLSKILIFVLNLIFWFSLSIHCTLLSSQLRSSLLQYKAFLKSQEHFFQSKTY